jgi:hypothetical protein
MFWSFDYCWDKARGTGTAGSFKEAKGDQSYAGKSKMLLKSKFKNVSCT